MDNLQSFIGQGLWHVLDVNGYDHILFLIVLAVPYLFSNWRKVLLLVTLFTIGHTISLFLAAYKLVTVHSGLVEFLIPVTIGLVALYNIFTVGKYEFNKTLTLGSLFTLIFGIIHGLGFSGYFKMIIGREEDKLIPLLEFALGIEIAQVIIVLSILLIGWILQTIVNISKRDWVLVLSSIVIGLIIPMLLER